MKGIGDTRQRENRNGKKTRRTIKIVGKLQSGVLGPARIFGSNISISVNDRTSASHLCN
jgi:hypothetical protein